MNERSLAVRFPTGRQASFYRITSPDGSPTWVAFVPVDKRRFNALISGLQAGDRISAWFNNTPMQGHPISIDENGELELSSDQFGRNDFIEHLTDGGSCVITTQVDSAAGGRWQGRLVIGTSFIGQLLARGAAASQKDMAPRSPMNAHASHMEGRF